MIVNEDILSVWRKFTENGEYAGNLLKLAEKAGFSYNTVIKAINTGRCSPRVHEALNSAASDIILEIRESAQKLKDVLRTPIA